VTAVLVPAALAASFAGVVASGSTAQSAALPAAACEKGLARAGTISIGALQNSETVCLTVGQKLLVELASPATAGLGWEPVQVSPPGILVKGPSTAVHPRFVTEATFTAKRKGIAELGSQRPTCAAPIRGGVTCGALLHWGARVIVVAAELST
jgi:hypothetical protein